jgi:hypothetical protein
MGSVPQRLPVQLHQYRIDRPGWERQDSASVRSSLFYSLVITRHSLASIGNAQLWRTKWLASCPGKLHFRPMAAVLLVSEGEEQQLE